MATKKQIIWKLLLHKVFCKTNDTFAGPPLELVNRTLSNEMTTISLCSKINTVLQKKNTAKVTKFCKTLIWKPEAHSNSMLESFYQLNQNSCCSTFSSVYIWRWGIQYIFCWVLQGTTEIKFCLSLFQWWSTY